MKDYNKPMTLGALLIVCCTSLLCNQHAALSKTTGSHSNLSTSTLNNTAYMLQDCYEKPIRLKNGGANGKGNWFCQLEQSALGDLNGDGKGDGVVVLGFSGGGSGYFVRLVAMLNENGRPVQAAVRALGDRVEVKKLSIKNQTVQLVMMDHGPNDGLAQVSVKKTITLRLKNKAWQVIKEVEN
jgi:hypothetical protein